MTKKLLVLTTLYPNNVWNNFGVFIKERMVAYAKQKDCEIKVVAPVPYFPPIKLTSRWLYRQVAKHEIRDGLDVYHPRYFITPKVGMTLYGVLMFISILPLVRKLRRDFAFELIDSHYVFPDAMAAVLLGQYFNVPVVVSARGSDINLYRTLPLIPRLLRFTLRRARKVIAVCQSLKDSMVELGIAADKIQVIPNGVDAAKFHPMPQTEARTRLGLPDRRIILSVGGLVALKGFDLLIEAVRLLRDNFQRHDVLLVICGHGPMQVQLEQQVAAAGLTNQVRFAGVVPHQDLYQWYSAADVFSLNSSREGWPNVLLESMACGTPAVATAVMGIPDIIRSSDVGLLTERNPGDIARNLLAALDKPWDRDAIVRYARSHTWEAVVDSVDAVFEEALTPVRTAAE